MSNIELLEILKRELEDKIKYSIRLKEGVIENAIEKGKEEVFESIIESIENVIFKIKWEKSKKGGIE